MNFTFDGVGVVPPGINPNPSVADVNPRCTSNKVMGCAPGDYWAGPGSEDSEARAYNCNWTHNILGLRGPDADCRCAGACRGSCKGCSCGCSWCRLREAALAAGAPRHTCKCARGSSPASYASEVGIASGPCVDTRYMQGDYPPTEGPTDADIRCAGCWWVKTQLGLKGGVASQQTRPPMDHQQGRQQLHEGAEVMDGITFGGRPVVIEGQVSEGTKRYPRPQQTTLGPRGLAGPVPQGLGAGAANATSPSTVGLVAALGGVVGSLIGAGIATEMGQGYGEATARRAAIGGLVGMMAGSFAGAALVAPSVQAQGA